MLPQDLFTLVAFTNNRSLQWCVVVLIFETGIDLLVSSLRSCARMAGRLKSTAIVQCGEVAAVLNIHINPRMVYLYLVTHS